MALASLYATKHQTMIGAVCKPNKDFPGGITNGAEWYEAEGVMQDFNYLYTNCMEITLELSCVKKPGEDKLQAEWDNNKEALLSFVGRPDSSLE